MDHVYKIYEPLRLSLQNHGTMKADIKIIPIVISRTDTFHVKTRAEIAKLGSFEEEPPDELTFILPIPAKNRKRTPRVYMHKNGFLIYKKNRERSSPQKPNGHKNLYLSHENLCPKALLILVAKAEEEDVEQVNMAYTVDSLSLP